MSMRNGIVGHEKQNSKIKSGHFGLMQAATK
jgi:hypothetical protein